MYRQEVEALERRRQILRVFFLGVILFTLPLYCIGFWMWGSAPRGANGGDTRLTPFDTNTPLGNPFVTRTIPPTVQRGTPTSGSPLQNTPGQFLPRPTIVFVPTWTSAFIPTSTPAPSLTPYPTFTPPPTWTPVPTNTNPPVPTATFTETPTWTPLPFDPIPSETPTP
jgi:hypothetical protein